jgi:hypothetical protein
MTLARTYRQMIAERHIKEEEMCSDKCCGQPVSECTCPPDCDHCDCNKDMAEEALHEEQNYKVEIEGLPMMFMTAKSPGQLKVALRKMFKRPDMIQNVERVPDAEVKRTFRLKAQGKDEEGAENE